MLADALAGRSTLGAPISRDFIACVAWELYRALDHAPDFPVIRIKWGPFRFTATKEACEPALRWLLTRLVGPEPEAVP